MRQNLWPNALAKLCGAALELPAKAGSSRILQSVALRAPPPLKGRLCAAYAVGSMRTSTPTGCTANPHRTRMGGYQPPAKAPLDCQGELFMPLSLGTSTSASQFNDKIFPVKFIQYSNCWIVKYMLLCKIIETHARQMRGQVL